MPATLVTTVSGLVDQLVTWMSDGFEVTLEKEPIVTDVAHPGETQKSDLRRPTVAGILDKLVPPEDTHDGQNISPLFEDIQAAAHLAWSVAAGRSGVESVAPEESKGLDPEEEFIK
jgi:hypothetical protein